MREGGSMGLFVLAILVMDCGDMLIEWSAGGLL